MSKVIRQGQEVPDSIHPFALEEISSDALYHHGSLFTFPTVIRDAADYPFSIEVYPLPDVLSATVEERLAPPPKPDAETAPEESEPSLAAECTTWLGEPALEPEKDGQQEAARLLQQAQEEAERCLAAAQEQAAAWQEEAYNEGYRRGVEVARQETATEYATLFASVRQAVEELCHVRAETLRQAEEDIVTLAFHLAHKITQHDSLCNPEVLRTTLHRALEYLIEPAKVVLCVHPADLARAQDLHRELQESHAPGAALIIQGDNSVGCGGCVVNSEFGTIDARIEAQLEELQQRFRDQLSLEGMAS